MPGNRVLLRAPNSPMHAACWFAVMKAGGIAVGTMPLLRAKELTDIVTKAQISHALCDHRLAAELDAARPNCPTLKTVAMFGTNERGRPRRARCGQAGDVRQRRHGGRRHGAHRVHLGHDRPAEGNDALSSRRDGGMRLLAALDAARIARRSVHRQPAARVHVRAGRPPALPAVDRSGDAARRAAVARSAVAGRREASRHRARHGAHVVPRDGGAKPTRHDLSSLAQVRVGGRGAAGGDAATVEGGDGHRDHRRHRRDRDAAHLHLARRGARQARRDGQADPGLRRLRDGRRPASRCRRARSAFSRSRGPPAAAISPTSGSRRTSRAAGTTPAMLISSTPTATSSIRPAPTT